MTKYKNFNLTGFVNFIFGGDLFYKHKEGIVSRMIQSSFFKQPGYNYRPVNILTDEAESFKNVTPEEYINWNFYKQHFEGTRSAYNYFIKNNIQRQYPFATGMPKIMNITLPPQIPDKPVYFEAEYDIEYDFIHFFWTDNYPADTGITAAFKRVTSKYRPGFKGFRIIGGAYSNQEEYFAPSLLFTYSSRIAVTIRACNSRGEVSEWCDPIFIDLPNPADVDFTATPRSGTTPLSVFFSNLTTGSVTRQLWDFGDGIVSTDKNPVHTYTHPWALYTVRLIVWGCANSKKTKSRKDYIHTQFGCPTSIPPSGWWIFKTAEYDSFKSQFIDLSGHNHPFTNHGASVLFWGSGFDGISEYLESPHFNEFSSDQEKISVGIWVRVTSDYGIIINHEYFKDEYHIGWAISAASYSLEIFIRTPNYARILYYHAIDVLEDKDWHFVGFTFDNGIFKVNFDDICNAFETDIIYNPYVFTIDPHTYEIGCGKGIFPAKIDYLSMDSAVCYMFPDVLPDADWQILYNLGYYLRVKSPNGYEHYYYDQAVVITWDSEGITWFKIEYSTDNGVTWNLIVDNFETVMGGRNWTIPHEHSIVCLVRISNAKKLATFDVSDSTFTIEENPWLTLTSPLGGETWIVNSHHDITWMRHLVEFISIYYSDNSGVDWFLIASAFDASLLAYDWTVPDTVGIHFQVKIVSNDFPDVLDQSNYDFSIIEELPPLEPIAYWIFKLSGYDAGNNRFTDQSGYSHHFINHGATIDDEKTTFDGVNNYLNCSDFNELSIDRKKFSCSIWVKTTADYGGLIGHMPESYEDPDAWYIAFDIDNVWFFIGDGTNEKYKIYHPSIDIRDGNWHLIGFTFNNNSLNIFIDGVKDTNVEKECDDEITQIGNSTGNFDIGRDISDMWYWGYIACEISKAWFFNDILSDTEWLNYFNQGH